MDWTRLAEPSEESTKFFIEEAKKRWPSWAPGLSLVTDGRHLSDDLWDSNDSVKIKAALAALTEWPEGYSAASGMAAFYRPLTVKPEILDPEKYTGCSCGHDIPSGRKGAEIYSTVDDPIGGAEGIVHETGHLRLEALGIQLESHDGRLLEADEFPSHDVVSPIRKDVLRPITAVVHAYYSYVMVVQLDVILRSRRHIDHNLPRIIEGIKTVQEKAVWTDVGKQFAKGLHEWADRVILQTQMI